MASIKDFFGSARSTKGAMMVTSTLDTAVGALYSQHVNPQWVRLLDLLEMNVRYERCLGSELFTADGRRIAALERLGVTLPALEPHRFRGIRFVSSRMSAKAVFPRGFAVGVRRTHLHRVMVEHAESAGVRFGTRSLPGFIPRAP